MFLHYKKGKIDLVVTVLTAGEEILAVKYLKAKAIHSMLSSIMMGGLRGMCSLITVFHILEWNARSLITDGQKLKTQRSQNASLILYAFKKSLRCSDIRQKDVIQKEIKVEVEQHFYRMKQHLEHQHIQQKWNVQVLKYVKQMGTYIFLNVYNPCKVLHLEILQKILDIHRNRREIWYGDSCIIIFGTINNNGKVRADAKSTSCVSQ